MTEVQWIVLAVAVLVLMVLVEFVHLWTHDRGAFWAAVGVPAGLWWCIVTALGHSYTTWTPDLAGITNGWGYAVGGAVALLPGVGGAYHR